MTTDSLIEWKRGNMAYRSMPDKFVYGHWHYKAQGPFRIMGIIDGYAMVRIPRCSPFVVAVKDLRKTSEECIHVK